MGRSLVILLAGILIFNAGHGHLVRCKPVVPAVILFGDSTVDTGNNNHLLTLAKSNHPPYGRDFPDKRPTGRFSNGFLATDHFASMLGLPYPIVGYLTPEAVGDRIVAGVSFASAATGYYDGTAKIYNVLSFPKQLELYRQYQQDLVGIVGAENASRILAEAIHIISAGTNDFLNNYYSNVILQIEYNRRQYRNHLLENLYGFIKGLESLGARRVAIISLPPMGCIPFEIALHGYGKQTCVKRFNREAMLFNTKLENLLQSMNGTGGMKLAYLDVYSPLLDAARFPAKYGFVEGRRGCCGKGLMAVSIFCNMFCAGTCSNASKYVFWDSFHPSDRMNFLLAKSLLPKVIDQLL